MPRGTSGNGAITEMGTALRERQERRVVICYER